MLKYTTMLKCTTMLEDICVARYWHYDRENYCSLKSLNRCCCQWYRCFKPILGVFLLTILPHYVYTPILSLASPSITLILPTSSPAIIPASLGRAQWLSCLGQRSERWRGREKRGVWKCVRLNSIIDTSSQLGPTRPGAPPRGLPQCPRTGHDHTHHQTPLG